MALFQLPHKTNLPFLTLGLYCIVVMTAPAFSGQLMPLLTGASVKSVSSGLPFTDMLARDFHLSEAQFPSCVFPVIDQNLTRAVQSADSTGQTCLISFSGRIQLHKPLIVNNHQLVGSDSQEGFSPDNVMRSTWTFRTRQQSAHSYSIKPESLPISLQMI